MMMRMCRRWTSRTRARNRLSAAVQRQVVGLAGSSAAIMASSPWGIGAEVAVDVLIGPGVVLVKGGCVVRRIERRSRHAQVLEVVQPVDDAVEVTAVATELHRPIEILAGGGGPGFLAVPVLSPQHRHPVLRGSPRTSHPAMSWGVGSFDTVAVSESLHEDLIPDRVLRPGGDGQVRGRSRRLLGVSDEHPVARRSDIRAAPRRPAAFIVASFRTGRSAGPAAAHARRLRCGWRPRSGGPRSRGLRRALTPAATLRAASWVGA